MKILNIILLGFSIVTFLSCKKVTKSHPEMRGEWFHHEGQEYYYKISIEHSGYGSIIHKTEEGYKIDSQRRIWRLKNDFLIFSSFRAYEFHIDQYPMVAETKIISVFDTIKPFEKYMILDGKYFKKR